MKAYDWSMSERNLSCKKLSACKYLSFKVNSDETYNTFFEEIRRKFIQLSNKKERKKRENRKS